MARINFPGGSYQLQNQNADDQACVNFIPEADESGVGISALHLNPTPGLALFLTLPDSPVRAVFEINGRAFVVAGLTFFEILVNGTSIKRGTVANDGQPAQIAANATQLLIASGGNAYYFQLTASAGDPTATPPVAPIPANTFAQLDTTSGNQIQGPVFQCGGTDGYLIVLLANSQQIQISNPEDATQWQLSGVPTVIRVSEFPDNIVGMLVDHRQVWLQGSKATVPYYDAGDTNIFEPIQGGYVEQGSIAAWASVKMNNGVYFISGSDRGAGIAYVLQGSQPSRISTHAVEYAWSTYATIADAWAYTYEDGGHTFWVIRFPTAGKTWVYDAATGLWHERTSWNAEQGMPTAHLSCCHMYVFGMHLVGDPTSGNIYQMANPAPTPAGGWTFVTDNGAPIQRIRRAPFVSTEQTWIFHNQFQVYLQSGVGPQPPLLDGDNNPRAPELLLRWSDDGGHTWSQYLPCGFGLAGDTTARAIWRRLGKSRTRVYEVSCMDPVPVRIVDAYLIASPGFAPQERLVAQYGKVS